MDNDNPYAQIEGYTIRAADGEEIGAVERTVYDAPSGVLKYVVVNGRPIPADGIEVDHEVRRISVPYSGEKIKSAPALDEPSGEFDERLRQHYGA